MPIGLRRWLPHGRHVTVCQCFRLHLEIDFGVDVGCIQRDMPQPRPDRVDIDPSAQQMYCSGVPLMPRTALDMRSLCGAPPTERLVLGWNVRWGLHIDLA